MLNTRGDIGALIGDVFILTAYPSLLDLPTYDTYLLVKVGISNYGVSVRFTAVHHQLSRKGSQLLRTFSSGSMFKLSKTRS